MNERAILEWAKSIISGVGGLEDLYIYECAVDNLPHDETVVVWTLKCLANPRCEGGKSVLDEILTARGGEPGEISQENRRQITRGMIEEFQKTLPWEDVGYIDDLLSWLEKDSE
jgi:hypothetical protein